MIIRKRPEEIDRIARAGALVAETIAHVGERIEPGITTGELDRDRRPFHPLARGCLDLEGVPRRLPGRDLHLAERRGRARDPRPPPRPGRRRDHDRRRRHPRRLRSRTARTRSPSVASTRRRSGCSTSGRTRSPPVSRRPSSATGSATSRTPCRRVVEGAGFSVVRSLVGHGVGRHYHEDPHVPNFGLPGRGPTALRGDDDRDRADDHGRVVRGLPSRRRLVDHHRGRLPGRPFRAHGRDHRRRSQNPDTPGRNRRGKGEFATVSEPAARAVCLPCAVNHEPATTRRRLRTKDTRTRKQLGTRKRRGTRE